MENGLDLTEDQREELLVRLDFFKTFHMTTIVVLITIIANLMWGNWQTLVLTIGIIAGLVGIGTLTTGWKGSRRKLISRMANWRSVGGDSYTKPSLRENIGFTIMLFAVFGVVHLLWWSDHLMRMIQIYLGLTAFSVLIIGEALMDRIEDKLRRDQGFREILDQHREKEPE